MIEQPNLAHLSAGYARLLTPYTVRAWPFSFTVYAPFTYDGASIPEIFRPAIGGPWDPRRLPAATVHDWLYASHASPKWFADLMFGYILILTGMPFWRAVADWWAVSRFGASAWYSHKPKENAVTKSYGKVSLDFTQRERMKS